MTRVSLVVWIFNLDHHRCCNSFFCLNSQFGCDMSQKKIHDIQREKKSFQSYHSHFDELSWENLLIMEVVAKRKKPVEFIIVPCHSESVQWERENSHYWFVNIGCDVMNLNFHITAILTSSVVSKSIEFFINKIINVEWLCAVFSLSKWLWNVNFFNFISQPALKS